MYDGERGISQQKNRASSESLIRTGNGYVE